MVLLPETKLSHPFEDPFQPGGPYFIPSSEKDLDWDNDFTILTVRTNECVNKLSYAHIRVRVPHDLLEKTRTDKSGKKIKLQKQSWIKTTEDFLASQLLKHVTIAFDRPYPDDVPKEFFPLTTHLHGILVSVSLEFTSQYDVFLLELKPYFWLLTQQNHYRSFENLDAIEIIKEVFTPYEENPKLNKKFLVRFECQEKEMLKRIQTIQRGETDFEFVLRLMEETGLSYFFYHDQHTSVLVITDKIASTFDKIGREGEFRTITKALSYSATIAEDLQTHIERTEGMSLNNYKIALMPPLAKVTVSAHPDYRKSDELIDVKLEQTAELFVNSDGFPLAQTVWMPTSQLTKDQKKDKVDYLTAAAEYHLSHDFSSKFVRSASVRAYGFIPNWRTCEIDLNIDQRRQAHSPTNYISAVSKKQKVYPYDTEHHFIRPLKVQQIGQPQSPGSIFLNFQVFIKFCNVGDDTFKPPFEYLQPPLHDKNSANTNNPVYSAVVVDFKKEDKTENNFNVPNMFRIRLPWHKPNESIRARVSFFWTGNEYGSLFLPEVGSEVLVVFLAGDKDYPVIIGSLYNSKNDYPLDVKKREEPGKFGARGVIFPKSEAQIVYETIKIGKEETKILTVATTDGNIMVAASNININAQKTVTTSVEEAKSSFTMDDKAILLNGFDNGGTVKIEKNTVSTKSAQVIIDGDSKVDITAGTISANSLKLPK